MKVPLRGQWVALAFFSFVFFMPVRAAETENFKWVRAVRLSFIQGKVNLQRSDPNRSLQALVHTPIQEGFTLATEAGGFAEVEFENGSAVRVGEDSEVFFSQLARVRDTGAEVTRLLLHRGYASFQYPIRGKGIPSRSSPRRCKSAWIRVLNFGLTWTRRISTSKFSEGRRWFPRRSGNSSGGKRPDLCP